jgi:chromosome segregation ATPase
MAAGSSTVGGSNDIGKGLFGYRKSDVEHLIADRDLMLRQAEKRIRAGEARVAELEKTLAEANERKARLEEQVRRLRKELDATAARTGEVEQLATQVTAESEKMASWKDSIQGLVEAMVPTVERFRVVANDVPVKVDQALSPLSGRIASLLGLIEEFGRAVSAAGDGTR